MPYYLTKSDFTTAQMCATKLYYRKLGYPTSSVQPGQYGSFSEAGQLIQWIAQQYFPLGRTVSSSGLSERDAERTLAELHNEQVTLFEATLISDGKLARLDILHRQDNSIALYEVKSAAFDSEENTRRLEAHQPNIFRAIRAPHRVLEGWRRYLEDITFQTLIARELFPEAHIQSYLILPDKAKRVGDAAICSQFMFTRSPQLTIGYRGDLDILRQDLPLAIVDVTAEVNELLEDVRIAADTYLAHLRPDLQKIIMPLTVACRDCEYRGVLEGEPDGFRECWGTLGDVRPHLFDMHRVSSIGGRNAPRASALLREGKASLLDLSEDEITGDINRPGSSAWRQRIQLTHTRSGVEYRGAELDQLADRYPYPLHFIDFETTAPAIPYHAGMRPYEMIAFQWSCHTIREPGAPPEHAIWVNERDAHPNVAFATTLLDHIGDGTVLMWHLHERAILNSIAEQLVAADEQPALAAAIRQLLGDDPRNGRLVDMHELALKHYFHPRMGGSTSLKVVLDAIWQHAATVRTCHPEYISYIDGRLLSPYQALSQYLIEGVPVVVADGTGATQAYHAMLYGPESVDPTYKRILHELLVQYGRLDTLAMVMIWRYWTREVETIAEGLSPVSIDDTTPGAHYDPRLAITNTVEQYRVPVFDATRQTRHTVILPEQLDELGARTFLQALSDYANEPHVAIDFSPLEFVYPFSTLLIAAGLNEFITHRRAHGLAIPSAIYGSSKGVKYLMHLGFFQFVGINRGRQTNIDPGSSRYLPITIITRPELEQAGNGNGWQEHMQPYAQRLAEVLFPDEGEVEQADMLKYCLREIIRNVFEHARIDRCVAVAQRWSNGFSEVAIIDRGVGILESLRESHPVTTVEQAIEQALRPGISRLGAQAQSGEWGNSGFGLYVLSELGRRQGDFAIATNERLCHITQTGTAWLDIPFSGTAVKLKIYTGDAEYFPNLLQQIVQAGEAIAAHDARTIKSASETSKLL